MGKKLGEALVKFDDERVVVATNSRGNTKVVVSPVFDDMPKNKKLCVNCKIVNSNDEEVIWQSITEKSDDKGVLEPNVVFDSISKTVDLDTCSIVLEVKKAPMNSRAIIIGIIALAIGALIALGIGLWLNSMSYDGGTTIERLADDVDEQQKIIDQKIEQSKITMIAYPKPVLHEDGTLDIGFENNGQNGWFLRFELYQDDKMVYKSGIVEPDKQIASCKPDSSVHEGSMDVRVFRVDPQTSRDGGNWNTMIVNVVKESK